MFIGTILLEIAFLYGEIVPEDMVSPIFVVIGFIHKSGIVYWMDHRI